MVNFSLEGIYDPSRSLNSHLCPIYPWAHSQLYKIDSPIRTEKHVAPLRQYHLAYASGHAYVWKVIFGLVVVEGCKVEGILGFGVDLDEHDSVNRSNNWRIKNGNILLIW